MRGAGEYGWDCTTQRPVWLGPEACGLFLPDLGSGDPSLCMCCLGAWSGGNLGSGPTAGSGGCATLQLQSPELEMALNIIHCLLELRAETQRQAVAC